MSSLEGILENENLDKNNEEQFKNYIRDNHHLRSEKFVNENYDKLYIKDPHAARFIGMICRYHRNIDFVKKESLDAYKVGFEINIPFISLWLRIADELDLTFERLPTLEISKFPENISKKHWISHFDVSGWIIDLEDPLTIRCSAICKDPEIHRFLKKLEEKVKEQLELLLKYSKRYKNAFRSIPRNFLVDITSEGYEPWFLKFQIESNEILEHLTHSLYYTPSFAIREILKNAIDSCRLRSNKSLETYAPMIRVTLNDDQTILTVEDNGMGMSKKQIKNFFTKIGKSYYKSKIDENSEFYPLGELGIGVLSYFRITKKIIVDTRSNEDGPIMMQINDVFDYMFISKGNKKNIGTKIEFYLNDKIILDLISEFGNKIIDKTKWYFFHGGIILNQIISKYLTHVDIPVELITKTGKSTIINKGYDLIPTNFNSFYYKFEIKEKDLIGQIVLFPARERYPYPLRPNEKVSHGGVLVTDDVSYLSDNTEFNTSLVKYDINFLRNSIDLTLSRDRIIFNEKWNKQIQKLRTRIIEKLPSFFNEYISYLDNLNDNEIERKIRRIFWRGIRSFEDPKIQDLIRDFFYVQIISESGVQYIKYEELCKKKKEITIIRLNNFDSSRKRKIEDQIDLVEKVQNLENFIDRTNVFIKLCELININHENLIFTVDFGRLDGFLKDLLI